MTTLTKYFEVPDLVRYASAVGVTSASSVLLGGVLLNINYYNWRFDWRDIGVLGSIGAFIGARWVRGTNW